MTVQVKFYWWQTIKVWKVSGKNEDEIIEKCHNLCEKYHATHFEVLG